MILHTESLKCGKYCLKRLEQYNLIWRTIHYIPKYTFRRRLIIHVYTLNKHNIICNYCRIIASKAIGNPMDCEHIVQRLTVRKIEFNISIYKSRVYISLNEIFLYSLYTVYINILIVKYDYVRFFLLFSSFIWFWMSRFETKFIYIHTLRAYNPFAFI